MDKILLEIEKLKTEILELKNSELEQKTCMIKQNMEISSLKQRIIALENGGTITSEHETSFGNFK